MQLRKWAELSKLEQLRWWPRGPNEWTEQNLTHEQRAENHYNAVVARFKGGHVPDEGLKEQVERLARALK